MRFFIALFFAASLASAYTVLKRQTTVPACAQKCYTDAIANPGPAPCNATDVACLCLDKAFGTALATCTTTNCSGQDLQNAQTAGIETCKAAGVDISGTSPFPACAQACVANPGTTTCAATDYTCLCKDPNYIGPAITCVHGACTGQDLTNAETVGIALCKANGVDISSAAGPA